jgi:chorismate mutase
MSLAEIRNEIDHIDSQIVQLLEERMTLITQVVQAKQQENRPVLDISREEFVLKKVLQEIQNSEFRDSIAATFKDIMKQSREYQLKNQSKNITPPKYTRLRRFFVYF